LGHRLIEDSAQHLDRFRDLRQDRAQRFEKHRDRLS
jgi:hypothetical protein